MVSWWIWIKEIWKQIISFSFILEFFRSFLLLIYLIQFIYSTPVIKKKPNHASGMSRTLERNQSDRIDGFSLQNCLVFRMKINVVMHVKIQMKNVSHLVHGHNDVISKPNMPMQLVWFFLSSRWLIDERIFVISYWTTMYFGTMGTRITCWWMSIVYEIILVYVFIGYVQWCWSRIHTRFVVHDRSFTFWLFVDT